MEPRAPGSAELPVAGRLGATAWALGPWVTCVLADGADEGGAAVGGGADVGGLSLAAGAGGVVAAAGGDGAGDGR